MIVLLVYIDTILYLASYRSGPRERSVTSLTTLFSLTRQPMTNCTKRFPATDLLLHLLCLKDWRSVALLQDELLWSYRVKVWSRRCQNITHSLSTLELQRARVTQSNLLWREYNKQIFPSLKTCFCCCLFCFCLLWTGFIDSMFYSKLNCTIYCVLF